MRGKNKEKQELVNGVTLSLLQSANAEKTADGQGHEGRDFVLFMAQPLSS